MDAGNSDTSRAGLPMEHLVDDSGHRGPAECYISAL